MSGGSEFEVVRASEIRPRPEGETPWLVEGLWGAGACGVIGGAPKSCKSWLSLEMAVAVASGRPCLGRYGVPQSGPVLVYAAEDAPLQVRERLEGLCLARGAEFQSLEVGLILEPCLRIDRPEDVERLGNTLGRARPRLLVLDPYVRLQRVDENNSTEVSAVLGALRELSRAFSVAIALVHHARKSPADQAGQALRGSSDFHAWGDSNLYLGRRGEDLVLSIEHRAAASPAPVGLRIQAVDGSMGLEVRDLAPPREEISLTEKILRMLSGRGPCWQEDLRKALRVRKQDLIDALHELEVSRRASRTPQGWTAVNGHGL
jgi:hypothetical protein